MSTLRRTLDAQRLTMMRISPSQACRPTLPFKTSRRNYQRTRWKETTPLSYAFSLRLHQTQNFRSSGLPIRTQSRHLQSIRSLLYPLHPERNICTKSMSLSKFTWKSSEIRASLTSPRNFANQKKLKSANALRTSRRKKVRAFSWPIRWLLMIHNHAISALFCSKSQRWNQ